MTREEKSKVIEDLTAQLGDNTNIYLTDISGLDAGTTSNLRRACFKSGIKLAVVKNTLLSKAMDASDKDFAELPGVYFNLLLRTLLALLNQVEGHWLVSLKHFLKRKNNTYANNTIILN